MTDPRQITIVGPCAAGKSTLARDLTRLGYDVRIVGQEHSEIPDLWKRHGGGVLVFLDVTLDATRQRRKSDWPESTYQLQQSRLGQAREEADVLIDTSESPIHRTMAIVTSWLERHPDAGITETLDGGGQSII